MTHETNEENVVRIDPSLIYKVQGSKAIKYFNDIANLGPCNISMQNWGNWKRQKIKVVLVGMPF